MGDRAVPVKTMPAQKQVDLLLVDDDRTGLMILSRSLERGNFTVACAGSATDALAQLETVRPEVIIADVSMPGMDGFEFLKAVRAKGLTDVPFIFCSGRDGALDRITGLRMGADDYLVKPIVPEEVILKVRLQITKVQYLRALKMALERRDSEAVMSGNFGGISVIDVLQTARMLGNGEYAVHFTTDEDSGAIYLRDGRVLHAETGWRAGSKAFARILAWDRGTFNIENKHFDDEPTINGALEELLLDHLAQLDEARELVTSLQAKSRRFTISLSEASLSPSQLRVCDTIVRYSGIQDILDNSPLSDRDTAEAMLQLLQLGAIKGID